MIKATVKPKIKETKYYDTETDEMWLLEVECLMPWMSGKGIDVGCGARTFSKDILRVDIDKAVKPDIVASGDKMPLKDEEFDYLISIHSFEHFENPKKVLTEWLRVLKVGGVIGIVHPDINSFNKIPSHVDIVILDEYEMVSDVFVSGEMYQLPDQTLAFVIPRMCLAGKDELDRSFLIRKDLFQANRISK